jgi:hypothetical protein
MARRAEPSLVLAELVERCGEPVFSRVPGRAQHGDFGANPLQLARGALDHPAPPASVLARNDLQRGLGVGRGRHGFLHRHSVDGRRRAEPSAGAPLPNSLPSMAGLVSGHFVYGLDADAHLEQASARLPFHAADGCSKPSSFQNLPPPRRRRHAGSSNARPTDSTGGSRRIRTRDRCSGHRSAPCIR